MGGELVIWLSPFVGAAIGWFTNWLAIYLLFRPRQPWRIPFLPLQGLLPRRQRDLARSVGEVVQTQLMPVEALLEQINLPALKASVGQTVAAHVRRRLDEQWPRFLPVAIREAAHSYLTDVAVRETSLLFDRIAAETEDRLRAGLQVGRLAEQQVMALDLDELERLVRRLAHREIRHIECLGAILGFTVGSVQLFIWWLIRGGGFHG